MNDETKKRIIKIVAVIIDVVFLPLRLLVALEICITGAIMADLDVKEQLKGLVREFINYPQRIIDIFEEHIFD